MSEAGLWSANFKSSRQTWDAAHKLGGELLSRLVAQARAVPPAPSVMPLQSALAGGPTLSRLYTNAPAATQQLYEEQVFSCRKLIAELQSVCADLETSQKRMALAARQIVQFEAAMLQPATAEACTQTWQQKMETWGPALLKEECDWREAETQLKAVIVASIAGELGRLHEESGDENGFLLPGAATLQRYVSAWRALPYSPP